MDELKVPSIEEIRSARRRLGKKVRRTPVWPWKGDIKDEIFGPTTELILKLELLQYGGSFKCRGSLMNMFDLSEEQLQKGVTAVSAGNHAISVAYAAKTLQTTAKVVMPETANNARIERCKILGANVVLVENVHTAFEKVKEIEEEEGRYLIHPFEGPLTALGTATVGLELSEQAENLDAVVVPIGGGGLIAGISSFFKQHDPDIKIYGVEPVGADSMSRSFAAGRPESIEKVDTIADSLGAPYAAPYSFGLSYKFVDEIVTITDAQMTSTMELLFNDMKLAVEPAGASATAALRFPLSEKLRGKRVGIIVCGTNIDIESYYKNITGIK
ncbi:MAG TPA: threonine/serine dehydratase [Balneolaceae bacterium]|nr:threonine/serine dehydratase [Balneolaceae bacterium]